LKFALTPAISTGEASEPVQVAVNASINQCDVWLASRSTLKAWRPAFFNLIDIKAAIETCKEAVQRYPEIGRFRFELARALYADGQYQKAEEQLVQAKDQGYVRAAQLLGRFYQLGLNGKADPARGAAVRTGSEGRRSLRAIFACPRAAGRKWRQTRCRSRHGALGQGGRVRPHLCDEPVGRRVQVRPQHRGRPFALGGVLPESTDRGDVWGMVNLGLLYRDGVGVAKDGKAPWNSSPRRTKADSRKRRVSWR
jgi:tetratricopeptide (TPR) repeat protein